MRLENIIKNEKAIKITIRGKEQKLYESQYSALIKISEENGIKLEEIKKSESYNKSGKYFGIKIKNKSITNLQINEYELKIIPAEIGQLTQLKELSLYANKIISLPEAITSLTQLRKLDLSDNQLTVLPNNMGNLKQLTRLDLYRNQLTCLPESIGNLKKLTEINLSDNQLTNLPENIGNLKKLIILDLSDNQLTSLPESIGNLKQLINLELKNNQLSTLPYNIGHLAQLEKLNASFNQLKSLPKSIGNLKRLERLYLYQNQLTSLPKSIVNYLKRLNYLNLKNNQLTNSNLEDTLAEPSKFKQNLSELAKGSTIAAMKAVDKPIDKFAQEKKTLKKIVRLNKDNIKIKEKSCPDCEEERQKISGKYANICEKCGHEYEIKIFPNKDINLLDEESKRIIL